MHFLKTIVLWLHSFVGSHDLLYRMVSCTCWWFHFVTETTKIVIQWQVLTMWSDWCLKTWFLQEYPFFTMTSFPFGFIVHLGGVVSAKSVKLLDKIHNPGLWSHLSAFHIKYGGSKLQTFCYQNMIVMKFILKVLSY